MSHITSLRELIHARRQVKEISLSEIAEALHCSVDELVSFENDAVKKASTSILSKIH